MLKYLLDYTDKLWAFFFAIVYLKSCEEDAFYICKNANALFFRLFAIRFMIFLIIGLIIR
jgi:hypothetical protein